MTRRAALFLVAAVAASPAVWASAAAAQPDPTFRASCGELRARLDALDAGEPALTTIQVVGALTRSSFDGAVAYLGMCSAPDPLVLCVAYTTENRRVGDTVVLSGALERRGPDRVLLDPCLHVVPDGGG